MPFCNSERIHKSSMVSDRPGLIPNTDPVGQSDPSSPSMESATVVPSVARDGSGPPTPDPSDPTSHNFSSPTIDNAPSTSRMEYLRGHYRSQQLSTEAASLILSSWRSKTNKSYNSLFGRWHSWCHEHGHDPISGPVTNIANFLAELYSAGYQYNSLNSYQSAISSVHEKIDRYNTGQHPTIVRLLKGVYNDRPPLPRYSSTWNVQTVLDHLVALGDNDKLNLKQLSYKAVMLLALTRPSRSADLSQLDINRKHYKPDGVAFLPNALAKQSRQGRTLTEFFFPSFPNSPTLCPVNTLRSYEHRTQSLRAQETKLFIAIIKPHQVVTSSTIARWLKSLLDSAGIDTTVFNAHSTRGASTSATSNMGITTNVILKAADWSSESVFQRFYYKPAENPPFARKVLAPRSVANRK